MLRSLTPAGVSLRGKVSAAVLTALLPLWMVASVVKDVVHPSGVVARQRPLNLPATGGIALSDLEIAWKHIDELERLVTFLRTQTPGDAPIFLLTNEPMILFLSQRETLFPERAFYLGVLGGGLLPEAQLQGLDVDAMLERLENTPEAILIFRPDVSSARLLEALPRLRDFVNERCDVVTRIGAYRILRQKQG